MKKHTISIMNSSGDTKVAWAVDNEVEVETAKTEFNRWIESGYAAFAMNGPDQGVQLKSFDPMEKDIIMLPQMVGG